MTTTVEKLKIEAKATSTALFSNTRNLHLRVLKKAREKLVEISFNSNITYIVEN
jgi:hypothetical protein